jgi:hypothetical protein
MHLSNGTLFLNKLPNKYFNQECYMHRRRRKCVHGHCEGKDSEGEVGDFWKVIYEIRKMQSRIM